MKKIFAVSTLLVLTLALTGCQKEVQPEVQTPDKQSANELATDNSADQQAILNIEDDSKPLEQEAVLVIVDENEDTGVNQEASLEILEESTDTEE